MTKNFRKVIIIGLSFLSLCCEKNLEIRKLKSVEGSDQVIIVLTKDTCTIGKLYSFEKIEGEWKEVIGSIECTIGKKGFTYEKIEGDLKSPIGFFEIGNCYGIEEKPNIKIDYIKYDSSSVWVDDIKSKFYNTFQNDTLFKEWTSAEKLVESGEAYKYFVLIKYNVNPIVSGKGSAIFFHTWVGEKKRTHGCIAVSFENLLKVIKWLDKSKKPIIIQCPENELYKF